jgi:hypothetical protein
MKARIHIIYTKILKLLKIPLILVLIGFSKIVITTIPLKLYCSKFQPSGKDLINNLQPILSELRLFNRVIDYFHLNISCLTRSLSIHYYFKILFQIDLQIHLYVSYQENDGLKAHAWYLPYENNQGFQKIDL